MVVNKKLSKKIECGPLDPNQLDSDSLGKCHLSEVRMHDDDGNEFNKSDRCECS